MTRLSVCPEDFLPGDVWLDRAETAGVDLSGVVPVSTKPLVVTLRMEFVRHAKRSSWDDEDRTHVRLRRILKGDRRGRESSQFLRTGHEYPIERPS